MKRGFGQLLILLIVLIIVGIGIYAIKAQIKDPKKSNSETNPIPQVSSVPLSQDDSIGWRTYSGKYFSFKHPAIWSDEPRSASLTGVSTIEVKALRINVSVFDAEYLNDSFSAQQQQFTHRESSDLTINDRKAIKFTTRGEGDPLPKNYSIITVIVEGKNNKSYRINFNGPNEEINDELIDQILSTFQFLD